MLSSAMILQQGDIQQSYRTVYQLLSINVAAKNIASCLKAVLKYAGKIPNRLPSVSTVNNMNTQRLLLAQKQLQEEIAPALNTTLETDETLKYGSKYGAYALRTEEGRPYVVGL